MSIRLSVDIGGTFTDVVLSQLGHLTTTKVLTTHADPALGVMTGIGAVLERSAVSPSQIDLVLHGTTLATNALIERRGAPTALLTTAGHRDVIEMASENRFEQYDVNIDRPAPLVPRRWRVGVPERMTFDGQILVPLDQSVLTSALDKLLSEGVKAVAIGYFHSYANAEHEQQTAALIAQKYPQLSVSRSSMVCPEIREYERLSTTVANAYVKPLMSKYLSSLAEQLRSRGIKAQVLMMTSGGGLTTLAAAAEYPIRLVESGPAGGAALAADIARAAKLDQVLSFDMGGTTAKICLITKVIRDFANQLTFVCATLSLACSPIFGRRLMTDKTPAHIDMKPRYSKTLIRHRRATRNHPIFDHEVVTRLGPVLTYKASGWSRINFAESPFQIRWQIVCSEYFYTIPSTGFTPWLRSEFAYRLNHIHVNRKHS